MYKVAFRCEGGEISGRNALVFHLLSCAAAASRVNNAAALYVYIICMWKNAGSRRTTRDTWPARHASSEEEGRRRPPFVRNIPLRNLHRVHSWGILRLLLNFSRHQRYWYHESNSRYIYYKRNSRRDLTRYIIKIYRLLKYSNFIWDNSHYTYN